MVERNITVHLRNPQNIDDECGGWYCPVSIIVDSDKKRIRKIQKAIIRNRKW